MRCSYLSYAVCRIAVDRRNEGSSIHLPMTLLHYSARSGLPQFFQFTSQQPNDTKMASVPFLWLVESRHELLPVQGEEGTTGLLLNLNLSFVAHRPIPALAGSKRHFQPPDMYARVMPQPPALLSTPPLKSSSHTQSAKYSPASPNL